MIQIRAICVPVLLAGALAGVLAGQSSSPWFGTWKLDVEKSKFRPGRAPLSIVTIIEPSDGGLRYRSDAMSTRGGMTHIEWSANFDGRDNPVRGDPDADTIALKRIDAHSYEVVMKKDGKVTATIRNVISRDGKVRTATALEKNVQLTEGSNIKEVVVFDRQ